MSRPYTIFVCVDEGSMLQRLQKALVKTQDVTFEGEPVGSITRFILIKTGIYAVLDLVKSRATERFLRASESGSATLYMYMNTHTHLEYGRLKEKSDVTWAIWESWRVRHYNALLALCGFESLSNKDGDHAVGLGIKSFLI